jgi:hypothetical protein
VSRCGVQPFRSLVAAIGVLCLCGSASAQQRPLITEDPEPVGTGRILIEGGLDAAKDAHFPASGLEGNLLRVPLVGVSIGLGTIAELQVDGGFFNRLNITDRQAAPLSNLLEVVGDTTHDAQDLVVATKIRLIGEAPKRPAFAMRFATRLPVAGNESGLGLGTTDFSVTVLGAKTVQSLRLVGNVGLGILGDPTEGHRQNDVLVYGVSFARALTTRAEFVGEVNGRVSTRASQPFPGTETRGLLNLGGRYTTNAARFDASVYFGMTTVDPTVGVTAGFTYVFNAFKIP